MKTFFVVFSILIFSSTAVSQPYWEQAMTTPHYVTSITESSSGKILASDYTGVIYSSVDAGSSWSVANDFGPAFSVASIGVNTNGDIYIAFRFYNGTIGLYRSTDDGISWNPVPSFPSGLTLSSVSFNASGHIFVSSYGYGGAFRSTDNGVTWQSVNTGMILANLGDIHEISVSPGGILFAGTDNFLYRSSDNGDNWIQINAAQGMTAWNVNYTRFANANEMYVSTHSEAIPTIGGVYKSIDAGLTWNQISYTSGALTVGIAVTPIGIFYSNAAYSDGIFYSTDGMATSTLINTGITSYYLTATTFIYSHGKVFGGFYQGIYRFITTPTYLTQWSNNPLVNNLVSGAASNQDNVTACPDGAGGIIMAWEDNRSGPNKIYIQKINSLGQTVYANGGIGISPTDGEQFNPVICSDAAGGCIVYWIDERAGSGIYNIYSQRIRTDGINMWNSDGVKVNQLPFNFPPNRVTLNCIESSAGASIIAWNESYSGTRKLYTQKLDAFGIRLWGASDVLLESAGVLSFSLCKSSSGSGAFFCYAQTGASADIYAQYVNTTGNIQWSPKKDVCTSTGNQTGPTMCEDQTGGFIVAWEDSRTGTNSDIYAQHFNSSGNYLWDFQGKAICVNTYDQINPSCISDLHSGAHIIWLDKRPGGISGDEIYGQNINFNGETRWAANGLKIADKVDYVTTVDHRFNPKIAVTDALGGIIVCWLGYYDAGLTQYGILTQRVDYYGAIQWDPNGVFASKGNLKKGPHLIFDGGSGGCNIAWSDGRYFGVNGYDIYAQHIKSGSGIGDLAKSNTVSKTNFVKQNYPNPFNPVTNISFNISQSGFVSLKIYDMTGREVAVLANGVYNPGQYSVIWDASNFATGAYFYKFITNEKTEIKTMMLIK